MDHNLDSENIIDIGAASIYLCIYDSFMALPNKEMIAWVTVEYIDLAFFLQVWQYSTPKL